MRPGGPYGIAAVFKALDWRSLFRRASELNVRIENPSMDTKDIKALQAPLKARYKTDPQAALVTLRAEGRLDEGISCNVETGRALVRAGLHPATGGTGDLLCSGDMLLQALVACAGVTLNAVAHALGVPVRSGSLVAEGDLDFRGTLGVSKDVPVGFLAIRLEIELHAEAAPDVLAKLIDLTERYCVVYQSLRGNAELSVSMKHLPSQGT